MNRQEKKGVGMMLYHINLITITIFFMLTYFDKLFAGIYYWYISKKETDIPALYGLLVVSLFQAFNVFAIIFLIGGILYGRNWEFDNIKIIAIMVAVLAFDYVRIYKVIGFKNVISKYDTTESRQVKLSPILYYILSILILVILRLIGFFPTFSQLVQVYGNSGARISSDG
ncbi:hypothetical protein ACI6Q2_22465 [Chitinophagaceae bacterium LWZ2-11]